MNHIVLEKEKREQDLKYWTKKLVGETTELNLPYDHPKSARTDFVIDHHEFTILEKLNNAIRVLSSLENLNVSIVIMAIFKVLLYRYSNEEGICIGTLVSKNNKTTPDKNPLVMKIHLAESMTFNEVLKEVKSVVLETYKHQSLSFDELTSVIREKDFSETKQLFNVMLEVKEMELIEAGVIEHHVVTTKADKVDLTLKVTEVNNELKCRFIYNKELFKKETIIRMGGHFNNILEDIIANPQTPISQVAILTPQEEHQLLYEWNKETVAYDCDVSITKLFEEQVRLNPNNVALIYGDEKVTYSELNIRANQIANYLKSANIKNEQLVAVCLNRSPDMIASFLGILKAGAAYVPIDLNYPKERIHYMLEDSGSSFVITTESISKELSLTHSKIVCLDRDAKVISLQSKKDSYSINSRGLAYVIYTSGSTGDPKGVMIEHVGVARLVKNISYANTGTGETFINLTAISFDVSIFEIYGSLLNGGKLVIMKSEKPSFEEISKEIQNNYVTSLCAIPGMLNVLIEDYSNELSSLKQILSAGEALPVWLAKKCLAKLKYCQLINAYGPSENSVYSTSYHVNDVLPNEYSISIGRPISNDQVFILDKHFHPVPIGVVGELYLAGKGIARGYYKKNQLTKDAFFNQKLSSTLERRLYKTGDLARYHSDGNIEFIGRMDNQVKIRGVRIELGEIETAISQFNGVRQTVVETIKNRNGDNDLIAYVVISPEESFDQLVLRSYLRDKLPEQLIPNFFVEMKEIPTTPVGKVDRKKLPGPNSSKSVNTIILPRNKVEEELMQLWEELLDVKSIGVTDHYFELGGNSLLAMQMFSSIEKIFNVRLPVSIIFEEDTIESLAAYITSNKQITNTSTSLVPIQQHGKEVPLFCIHGGGGEVFIYRELAFHLGNNQPLYGLRYVKDNNTDAKLSVEMLANKYVKEIRGIQPTGPYSLMGFCLGGAIAYEIGQQLIMEGHKVSLLTILNFANPRVNPVEIQVEITYKTIVIKNLKLLLQMPLKERASFFVKKVKNVTKLVKSPPEKPATPSPLALNRKILGKVIQGYEPKPYSGNVLLIRANEYNESFEENLGWEVTEAGSIKVHKISTDHESLLKGANIEVVSKYLKEYLERDKQREAEMMFVNN